MTHGVHSSLRVPADLAVVSFVRSAFACVLAREEWPAEGASRVLLASTEALTNAIEHGSREGAEVEVELSIGEERLDIRVVDGGRPGSSVPVVPSAPPPPTSLRGRGLIIISRLSDDFVLTAKDAGTQADVCFLRVTAPGAARAAELTHPAARAA